MTSIQLWSVKAFLKIAALKISSEKPQLGLEAVKLLNATIRLTTDALRKITSRIKSKHSVDAMSLS